VQALRRQPDGSLTRLGGLQDSGLTRSLSAAAVDASGEFLVVASSAADAVSSFSIDRSTGQPEAVDTEPAALEGPNGMVIAGR
jgi:hypothetical protein